MKRIAIMMLLLTALSTAAFAQSYSAVLTGASEVPGPGDADGTGLAVVTLDGTTLRYAIWTQGIGAPTMAHIHTGAVGVSGAILVHFDVSMLTNGTTTVSTEIADSIRANPSGFYVNVHNSEFPGGAVRGQLTGASNSGDGSSTSFIPVIGKVLGQAGTNFVTDLRIVNTGAATAAVTLDYYEQNPAGQTAPTVTKQVNVLPGEQKVLNDVVAGTLGLSGGLGGLRITSSSNVVASARVINDQRAANAGTAGFAIEAEDEPASSGTIAFLSASTDYRTNVGYFNPRSTATTATFVARRSNDGAVLGTSTITIPAFAMVQQGAFNLISVTDANQNDFYITWTASAPLFAYGAVTDNKTGDAVLNQ